MTDAFKVHIIESPSPSDVAANRNGGRLLGDFLDLAKIPRSYRAVTDREQFRNAVGDISTHVAAQPEVIPVLHFGGHGTPDGIDLTRGHVPWDELASLIEPISRIHPRFGVCLASCGGAFAREMAHVFRVEDVPLDWIVGTAHDVDLRDIVLAFTLFYRGLQRGGLSFDDLFLAIRVATGLTDFGIEFGAVLQENFVRYPVVGPR